MPGQKADTDERLGPVARAYPTPAEVDQAEEWLRAAVKRAASHELRGEAWDALLGAARGYTRLYDREKGNR